MIPNFARKVLNLMLLLNYCTLGLVAAGLLGGLMVGIAGSFSDSSEVEGEGALFAISFAFITGVMIYLIVKHHKQIFIQKS